jgi:hypothetical protein
MEAAISGTFSNDAGCTYVNKRSGRAAIVWAGDAKADASGGVVFAGRRFAAGDRVRFGGGYIAESTPGLREQIASTRCAGPYFLVQTVEEVVQ